MVDKVKDCMKDACKSDQPIIIGAPGCSDENAVGYTHRGPLNPFCGPGGAIYVCPNYIFKGEGGGADSLLPGTIVHEISHTCGVGEGWAYPIGDMF